MIGPQSREPSEPPYGEPWSKEEAAAAGREGTPVEPWLQPDRAPLSLRRAVLFLAAAVAVGLVVLYVVAWLMGF